MGDPTFAGASDNSFIAAVAWLGGALTGTLATSIATIAVASIGLLLLSGRISLRRSTQVLIGCFILFGAPLIAQGMMGTMNGMATAPQIQPVVGPRLPAYDVGPAQSAPPATPYDPYAGAALPARP